MLEAVEVSKKYWDRSSGRQYDVLQSCSLQIAAGEAVGLMGAQSLSAAPEDSERPRMQFPRSVPPGSGPTASAAHSIWTDHRRKSQFVS